MDSLDMHPGDNFSPIKFSDLRKYDDSNSIMFLSIIFPEDQNIADVQSFLDTDLNLIPKDKHVIGWHKLSDNVLGDDGRSDYLIEFDRPDLSINPMARLMYGRDIKWTSDFIDNYKQDYISGHE